MAQGDVVVFDQFVEDLGDKIHNLSGDTFYFALTNGTTTLAATTADPRWGTGGTTDLSAEEASPTTGNYPAGGINVSTTITDNWTRSGGIGTFDVDDVSITQNANNPTNARYGVIYNSTDIGKRCILFLDLGSTTDLSAGDFTVTWNASGLFTIG